MKSKNILVTLVLIAVSYFGSVYAQTENLTGEQISQNFIEAVGGKKKLKKIKSMKLIANAKFQGVNFQMESYRVYPEKMLVKMIFPRVTVKRILNNGKAFTITASHKNPITGTDLQAMQDEAKMFPDLYYEEMGCTLDYVGEVSVRGRDSYKVKVTLPNGQVRYSFYDKKTNLLDETIDESGNQTFYTDYKVVNGIKIPYVNTFISKNKKYDFKINKIEMNTDMEDKIFAIK